MQLFPPYTVRAMVQADIPAVVSIDRLSFSSPWPASSYVYELNRKQRSFYSVLLRPAQVSRKRAPDHRWRAWLRVLGAPQECLIAGYVGLRLEDGFTHISTLAVHPAWRRRGLGEALLQTAIQQTLELQVARVTLEVRASNAMAQRLYQKYGFSFTGVQPGYYRGGEDAWLMESQVGSPSYEARLADLLAELQERIRRAVRELHSEGATTGSRADPSVREGQK